jgi:hypothetical protein
MVLVRFSWTLGRLGAILGNGRPDVVPEEIIMGLTIQMRRLGEMRLCVACIGFCGVEGA